MATFENILVYRVGTDGRIGRVTLDRPDAANPALYPSDHAGIVADLAWR